MNRFQYDTKQHLTPNPIVVGSDPIDIESDDTIPDTRGAHTFVVCICCVPGIDYLPCWVVSRVEHCHSIYWR